MKKLLLLCTMALGTAHAQWTVYTTTQTMLSNDNCEVVEFHPTGDLWLGNWGGGLANYDFSTWTAYNNAGGQLPDDNVRALAFDQFNNTWIGTTSGLVLYNGVAWNTLNTGNSNLPDDNVRALHSDGSVLWVGTSNGLAKFDGFSWTIYNTGNSGITGDVIRGIATGPNDSLWVATTTGLSSFDKVSGWSTYTMANSTLPADMCGSIAVDAVGQIWISTVGGGVAIRSGVNFIVVDSGTSGFPSDNVNDVTFGMGKTWVGTDAGVAVFDGLSWTTMDMGNSGLPNDGCGSVAWDAGTGLWVATYGGGLANYAPPGLGLGEKESFAFTVSPNPANEQMVVEVQENATAEFFDMQGRMVKTTELNSTQNSISIAELENGVYMLRITSGDLVGTQQVVVKH